MQRSLEKVHCPGTDGCITSTTTLIWPPVKYELYMNISEFDMHLQSEAITNILSKCTSALVQYEPRDTL